MASRKNKLKVCDEDLDKLTKEELILQVQRLTAHNNQLKNVISKNLGDQKQSEGSGNKRNFDFAKCSKRHIFLKILYLGWDYQGYATQEDTNKTIEWELFQALRKSCLIEDRTTSNYHRCGRTDKGVSAFGQVISIDVRSKLKPKPSSLGNDTFDKSTADIEESEESKLLEGEICSQSSQSVQSSEEETRGELEYCKILNRLLPPSIRAIGWSPVQPHESARFDCKKRTYKYFFPRGKLNIESMVTAADHLVGVHDFRNLCKMDVGNGVINFQRKIFSISLRVLSGDQLGRNSGNKRVEDRNFESGLCLHCHVGEDAHDDGKCLQKMNTQETPSQELVENRELKYIDTGEGNFQDSKNSLVCAVKSVVPERKVQCSVGEEVLERKQSKQHMYDMCELTVVGQAFLWHQIRCIMTVLFLVGQGKEEPSVVEHLLNVDKFPRKPQYGLASEIPLNLFASDFESSLNWVYDRECIFSIIKDLQKEWTMLSVRATMIRQMLSALDNEHCDDSDASELTNCLLKGVRPHSYVPLLKRETCESLEDRIDYFVKRKRLNLEVNSAK